MQDFNSFVNNQPKNEGQKQEMQQMAKQLADAFEGKGETDVLKAIYKEAERGRKAGTLSDADLENFVKTVEPILSASQKKKLDFVINKLKNM